MKKLFIAAGILLSCIANAQVKPLPALAISSNKRFFQTKDGKPFFWLGDTGWLLFSKTSREDAVEYLKIRKEQGFNVVQVMVLHEIFEKNVYGDLALQNKDVSKPLTTPGTDYRDANAYDYWDHVDFIIDEAAKRGIYMGLVPVWGSIVKSGHVTVPQAEAYAKFLALRYRNKSNIIWLNGGDLKGTDSINVWNMIGKTIRQNDPNHLQTFHPRGRNSSSEWFHNASWLDFNMFQSGHRNYSQDTSSNEQLHYGEDNWRYIEADYAMKPIKPTLDGEPSYENIPHGLHDYSLPRWTAADVRRYGYWEVFAGGAGYTYGENAVMQFHHPGDADSNYGVKQLWKKAIHSQGATQMKYLKQLMLSYSYFDRVPDQSLVINNGERYERVAATRGKDYALLYTYTGRKIQVQMGKIPGSMVKASWFDPRTGKYTDAGKHENKGIKEFDPPGEEGNGNDWVLVLKNKPLNEK
jgi:hypothetical protein